MRLLFVSIILALALLGTGRSARGQSSSDVITGRVMDASGAPVAGAQVTAVSAESEMRRSAQTNQQGRFTIVFADGSGMYQLTVSFPGMAPHTRVVRRQADEEVLVANIRMDAAPVLLEGIEVIARQQPNNRGGITRDPNTQERALSGEALDRLPIDPSDLNAIATLTPGVVMVGDSLGNGFSVLGQGPSGNQVTLDGASFSGGEGMGGGAGMGVPTEAVRVTRVITNSYDVSRGQFSGGQIATTTRSGTNNPGGSLTFNLRDPALQWADASSAFDGSFRQSRVSGGMGGPIVRDKLFYFGSLSWQRRSEDLASLLSADATSLERLGVSPDSVSRLLALVESGGIYASDLVAPDDRTSNNLSFLGRMDYNLSDLHTLTLRLDGRWSGQDSFGGGLGFPQSGSTFRSSGGGAMATLTSRFGNGWINELRAYTAADQRESDPFQGTPAGRVRITSELDDGTRSVSSLSFGGGGMATESRSDNLEVTDELSLLIGTTHRIRAGATYTSVRSTQEMGANRFGTFTYQSLEDLAVNRPSSFTRNLISQERESGGWNGALWLGDTWRPAEALQITLGTRLETSRVSKLPEHNPAVESVFGRRTDEIPTEVAVTPRLGFSYTLGASEDGPPAGVVRGGLGAFRASPSWSSFAAARDLTGLPSAQSQLSCIGAAVPIPDWDLYLDDIGMVPSACVGEDTPLRGSGRGSSIAVFDPDYRTGQSWRASLGFQRRLMRFLGASIDLTYAEGRYQTGVRDLNLRATPAFALGQEDGRPVYVPAASIVERTGNVGFLASRRHSGFGQVLEVNSDLRSRTTQMTLGVNGFVPSQRISFSGSYSHGRTADQGSAGGWGGGGGFGDRRRGGGGGGIGSLPPTRGNPNQRVWGRSDFDRRHSVTGTLGRGMNSWLDFTLVGRASSGSPFSPLVGGDINGDGARNDLAFIFEPAGAVDPAVGEGMRRVLESVPERVRDCITSQTGAIAERNSCREPWTYSLDLRINVRPTLPQLGRRLSFSIDAVNSLGGLDRLLHGSGDLRGWGQNVRIDPVLLYPRGFDRETQSYRYEVNERFGTSRSSTQAFRNPFQLMIQGQVAVGRGRGQAGGFGGRPGMFGDPRGGRGDAGGRGGAGLDPAALLAGAFENPLKRLVGMADTLALTTEQVARVTAISAALQQKQDSLSSGVTTQTGRDVGEVFRALQPRLQESRRNIVQALAEAQEVLTPDQWAKVPEEVKTPPRPIGAQRREEVQEQRAQPRRRERSR